MKRVVITRMPGIEAPTGTPIPAVEFPLLGEGGVARGAGVVRNGDSTSQTGALYWRVHDAGEKTRICRA